MKILWISYRVPYDSVPHAGGKIHNFYLKKLSKKTNYDIHLVSFYLNSEKEKIDLDKTKIKNTLICRDDLEKKLSFFQKIENYLIRLNPFNEKIDLIVNRFLKAALGKIECICTNKSPDLIILQWTQIVSMLHILKKKYPNAIIIAIEEDVTFLSLKRRYDYTKNIIHKFLLCVEIWKMKKIEKKCLEIADLTILNNKKDEKLLQNNGIDANVWVWTPFFQNMLPLDCSCSGKQILFYGAMSRPENYLSAIWFIEKVFIPKLEQSGFCFIVVGGNPHELIKKYDNGNSIRIVGFVDDISSYFEESLCLVAPLVMGAGVKIKVVEAMSAGIPVLTNEIGIEGIFAENGKDYLFCKTPEDYEESIIKLTNEIGLAKKLGENAKAFIRRNYDYERDAMTFYEKIASLVETK